MMDDPRRGEQAPDQRAGLCPTCTHVQGVTNDRGSRFYLCRLSFTDRSFRRYPTLPVLACPGYVPAPQRPG